MVCAMNSPEQIAKCFEEVQIVHLKDSADKILVDFVSNDPTAVEILIQIITDSKYSDLSRSSAAIQLQLLIKKKYTTISNEKPTTDFSIKVLEKISPFVFLEARMIQDQLSVVVSTILDSLKDALAPSHSEFGECLSKFISLCQQNINPASLYGLLSTIQLITNKFKHESKNDELIIQILTIQSTFCSNLKDIFLFLVDLLVNPSKVGQASFPTVLYTMKICINIIHELNFYDLIEYFEDNLQYFFEKFDIILNFDCPTMNYLKEDIYMMKIDLMTCINFFHQQYLLDLKENKIEFFNQVYTRLLDVQFGSPTVDILYSKYFRFFNIVILDPEYKKVIGTSKIIKEICDKVIMQNVELKQNAIDEFNENPGDYINRELIKNDSVSRRKACCDFLKNLSINFEETVVPFFLDLINQNMGQYNNQGGNNWKDCETAITIMIAISARNVTRKHGASSCPRFVVIENIFDTIFTNFVQNHKTTNKFVVAACLKFVCTFRSMIGVKKICESFKHILSLLLSDCPGLILFSAYTLNQLLSTVEQYVANNDNHGVTEIYEMLPGVLQHLLKQTLTSDDDSPIVNSEILVKATIHMFVIFKHRAVEMIADHFDSVLTMLIEKIKLLAETPANATYTHNLYELLCVLIRISYQINSESIKLFEGLLFPVFEFVFSKQLVDSIPYVLQMIGMLLEVQLGSENISDAYEAMIKPLIEPQLWEHSANIQPVITLLNSIMLTIPSKLDKNFHTQLLGITKRLISTRSLESKAVMIIENIALIDSKYFEAHGMQKQTIVKSYIELILIKLNAAKTDRMIKLLCTTFALLIHKDSAIFLKDVIESIQPGLFLNVAEKLYLANLHKIISKKTKILAINAAVEILKLILSSQQNFTSKQIELGMAELQKALSKEVFFIGSDVSDFIGFTYDKSDQLELAASIGGLNFNKIIFACSKTPIDTCKIDPSAIKDNFINFIDKFSNTRNNELHGAFNSLKQNVYSVF